MRLPVRGDLRQAEVGDEGDGAAAGAELPELAEGDGAAGVAAAGALGAVLESPVAAAALAGAASPAFGVAAPLLRKSVTYQPEPLSWNPAAVTCLE